VVAVFLAYFANCMAKLFGIGFHKTGTTTLDSVYQLLGYHACPVRTDLAESLSKSDLEPTMDVVREFDAFQDNPFPILYKELDQAFLGSKFIMTVRDDEKWLKSIVNSFGKDHTLMRKWIYGLKHGAPKGNEEVYLERYQRHNSEVRAYFKDRPEDFLEISWERGDGWEKICPFLNVPIPTVSFPHANKGDYSKKKSKGFSGLFK
jgi:hypothetical protein